MRRLGSLPAINTLIGSPVQFRKPLPSSAIGGIKGFPRVYNVDLTYNRVRHGRLVNTVNGQWFNPFKPPKK